MALVLLTQYFDTLRDIGTRGGTNTLFLPNTSRLRERLPDADSGRPSRQRHAAGAGPNPPRVVEPERPYNPPPPPVGTPGTPNPFTGE